MTTAKRARATNWTEEDKKLLRRLILERAHTIENKDCSTNTLRSKKHAWEEVMSCFNAVSEQNRDTTQLVNQWRNMKNRAKKTEFAFRRAKAMTGGGPPPASPLPEDLEIINAIPLEFTVDSNTYDSDSIQKIKTQPTEAAPDPPLHNGDMNININELEKESPVKIMKKRVFKKTKVNNNCCGKDHEHELFLLPKKAREEAMEHAREVHAKRMVIMALEEVYWSEKRKKKRLNI